MVQGACEWQRAPVLRAAAVVPATRCSQAGFRYASAVLSWCSGGCWSLGAFQGHRQRRWRSEVTSQDWAAASRTYCGACWPGWTLCVNRWTARAQEGGPRSCGSDIHCIPLFGWVWDLAANCCCPWRPACSSSQHDGPHAWCWPCGPPWACQRACQRSPFLVPRVCDDGLCVRRPRLSRWSQLRCKASELAAKDVRCS